MTERDVLIIGAGPVGALSGLLLIDQGFKVTIVEKEPGISESPRALVYHPQTIGTLEAAGVLEDVQKAGCTAHKGIAWRKASDHSVLANLDPTVLHPEDKPQGKHRTTILLGQDKFNKIVLDKFLAKGGEVLFGHSFENFEQKNDKVHAEVKSSDGSTQAFTVSFLLGTDGGHSKVRKLIGQSLEGFTHPFHMVSVNLKYPKMLETGFGDANFLVDAQEKAEDSDFAVIIYTGTDDIWRCAYGDGDDFTEEQMRERTPMKLKRILPLHPDPSEYEVVLCQPYRIHNRCVQSFAKGRVLIAGDAAHLNSPLGGFGLNTGLVDARVAAIAITDAMHMSDEAAVEKRLQEYSKARRAAFMEMTNVRSAENTRRHLEKSDEAEQKIRQSYWEGMKDPAFQREVQLFQNKIAYGVPGF